MFVKVKVPYNNNERPLGALGMASGKQPTILESASAFPRVPNFLSRTCPPHASSHLLSFCRLSNGITRLHLSQYLGSIAVYLLAAHHEQRAPNPFAGLF